MKTATATSSSDTPSQESNTMETADESIHEPIEKPSSCGGGAVPPTNRRNVAIHFSVLLVGLLSAAAALAFGLSGAFQDQENRFARVSDDLLGKFDSVVHEYETVGLWIHEACRSREKSHEDFRTLYEYLTSTGLQFQAISFALKISHAEREKLENDTAAFLDSNPLYSQVPYRGVVGMELDPESGTPKLVERSEQPFYQPIHYLEPLEEVKNQAALDFDMQTSALRWTAIQQALKTEKPAVTERLKLIEETQTGTESYAYSVILMHPGMPGMVTEDVAVVALRFPEILTRTTLLYEDDSDLSLYVFDSTHPDDGPLYLGGARVHSILDVNGNYTGTSLPEIELAELEAQAGRHIARKTSTIGSREWTFVVLADDDDFRPDIFFVVFGSSIILVLTICLVCWMRHNALRQARLAEFQANVEAEKTALVVRGAKQAALAERELNDFIAHEVRNPLSAAISANSFVCSQLCQENHKLDKKVWDEMRDDSSVIGNSLSFINDLLRDMLDMHRANSNQLKIETTKVDMLKDILEPVAALIYRRGAAFEVIVDCSENLLVESDPLRLKQVVLNLGRNSAKFVTHGFVRFKACVVNGLVRLMIEDSGPGIPLEKQAALFDKFQESLDVLNQGTGIGLSLSRKLVDLMGYEIWLDQEYRSGFGDNLGACFVIDMKQEPLSDDSAMIKNDDTPGAVPEDSEDTATSEHEELPENISVLLVDDAYVLRKLYRRSLERVGAGWTIAEAANGETALQLTETESYDLIFVDQYMASHDKQLLGTETIREMRARGVASILCGLSANDLHQPFLDVGADGFMIKPFPTSDNELRKELHKLLASRKEVDASV